MAVSPFNPMLIKHNPLEDFLDQAHTSLLQPLNANQDKFLWKKELSESKKFREAAVLIERLFDSYSTLKNGPLYSERVWDALTTIHARRRAEAMTNFMEKREDISPLETEELQEVLRPFRELLAPVRDIQRAQQAMVALAKMQKMPLPYSEITATLSAVTKSADQLPQALMRYVSQISDNVEKAAA